MKSIKLFFLILLFIPIFKLPSQPFYTEQNSGVNTSLNSVTMYGVNINPIQVWVCGDAGVVIKSTNLGMNWLNASAGIPVNINLTTISSKSFDTVLIAGNIGTISYVYRTQNGGTAWQQVFSQPNGHINAIWMKNALQGVMVGNPVGGRWSIWKTTNGGVNWDSTGMYISQSGGESGFNNSLAVIRNNIWFGTNNSGIYRSSNNGLNWTFASATEVKSSAVWAYWDTTQFFYILRGGNSVNYSTNNGTNWSQITCPDTGEFRGFCPAYYGVSGNDLYNPMSICAVRNNNKIYFSNFSYNLFAEYTAPSGVYNHLAYDVGVMYWWYTWAVRNNGGITRFSLFRGGAVRQISSEIPESYKLEQNYPNPFNPATNIRFEIPPSKGDGSTTLRGGRLVEGMTKLVVYDILGNEVTTLVNEHLNPGVYETTFDASKFSSGIYYYRITAGDFTETKKMILIK